MKADDATKHHMWNCCQVHTALASRTGAVPLCIMNLMYLYSLAYDMFLQRCRTRKEGALSKLLYVI
jgi:hypothetical protein